MLFDHWSEVPKHAWPCKHFSAQEIACNGTGQILIHEEALVALDQLRDALGGPVSLSSAFRSPYHNAVVGGAACSQHLRGHAFDLRLRERRKSAIRESAEMLGFTGFGMNYQTFIHIDMGRRREW
jgi:zinc D-Ala-D-Ala carboxypeptidase